MTPHAYGFAAFWQQSDLVIKSVALILLIMSLSTWFIILIRSVHLFCLRQFAQNSKKIWGAQSIEEGLSLLDNRKNNNPFYFLALDGKEAVSRHAEQEKDMHDLIPLTEWLTISLRHSIDESAEKLQFGLSILASVGSTSPFIGLFGTVWGIYHALIGISTTGHVNISEVAGPVGEALIMTAFGLVVAIPAVLGYNAINRGNKNIKSKLNWFAYELHAYFMTGTKPVNRQRN